MKNTLNHLATTVKALLVAFAIQHSECCLPLMLIKQLTLLCALLASQPYTSCFILRIALVAILLLIHDYRTCCSFNVLYDSYIFVNIIGNTM